MIAPIAFALVVALIHIVLFIIGGRILSKTKPTSRAKYSDVVHVVTTGDYKAAAVTGSTTALVEHLPTGKVFEVKMPWNAIFDQRTKRRMSTHNPEFLPIFRAARKVIAP